MEAWLIWLIIAVSLIIIEVTSQIVCAFCMAVGAIGAMIASWLGASTLWQVVVMAVVAVIVYFTALPWFRRYYEKKSHHSSRTGMDALVGRRGVVTEEIKPGIPGRVRIDGDNWQAVASDASSVIKRGEQVIVLSYQSIVLTVKQA